MDFRGAVEKVYQQIFDYKGRAGKAEFWYFVVFCMLACVVLKILTLFILSSRLSNILEFVLLGIPLITCGIRRLHDTGKSAFYGLIGCIPVFGQLVLLYWLTRDSDPRVNLYGANPKDIDV